MNRKQILQAINDERERQDKMWGKKADKLNTRNDWASYIARYVLEGAYNGRQCQYSDGRFREYLIKAAAMSIACIELMDEGHTLPETEIQKFLGKG